jgi:hypothetical protein
MRTLIAGSLFRKLIYDAWLWAKRCHVMGAPVPCYGRPAATLLAARCHVIGGPLQRYWRPAAMLWATRWQLLVCAIEHDIFGGANLHCIASIIRLYIRP